MRSVVPCPHSLPRLHNWSPTPGSTLRPQTPDQLSVELVSGEVVLVDLREPAERTQEGHVEGAVHAPLGMLEFYADPTSAYDRPEFDPQRRWTPRRYGNHSVAAPMNIGITNPNRRTPDLPLCTLRNKATGAMRETSDPSALITGKWADIGKFKGPILRGLAARAPYFHNGSAATLDDVVDFYNHPLRAGRVSRGEHEDLVAFPTRTLTTRAHAESPFDRCER